MTLPGLTRSDDMHMVAGPKAGQKLCQLMSEESRGASISLVAYCLPTASVDVSRSSSIDADGLSICINCKVASHSAHAAQEVIAMCHMALASQWHGRHSSAACSPELHVQYPQP